MIPKTQQEMKINFPNKRQIIITVDFNFARVLYHYSLFNIVGGTKTLFALYHCTVTVSSVHCIYFVQSFIKTKYNSVSLMLSVVNLGHEYIHEFHLTKMMENIGNIMYVDVDVTQDFFFIISCYLA